VLAICARADVPAGLLNSIADIFADPQYRARGNIGTYPSRIGELAVPEVVPRLSATPGAIKWLGPALGEHNDEVLREVLGLSEHAIADLRKQGVI
jgi:crotonobetainyl-CoA:carnitine CoA-transferase CaiB-like acyl-CoA transferase